MDHAIADSHAVVTISHSRDQESPDPPKARNAEIPPMVEHSRTEESSPDSLSYFGTRGGKWRKARVRAVRHP
ncbi:hypothetical protein APS67_006276 [Streptomyces sp. AVP053U2]|nr:hypothetical protein APS67_006276 [Streptomyces sp. AVP053U2]